MTLFQWVFGSLFVLSFAASILLTATGRARRASGLGWALLWAAATLFVLRPELTARLSRAFGIGRGVDLVIYLNIVAGLYATLVLYTRSRRLERIVTELVRQQALSAPSRGDAGDEGPAAAARGPEAEG